LKNIFECASMNPMAKMTPQQRTYLTIDQGNTAVTYNVSHIDMLHSSGGRVELNADLHSARTTTKLVGGTNTPVEKEVATVNKKYDVDPEKNTAIDTLVLGVKQLEQALFQEKQQIDRVSREQAWKVEQASASLNHQIAESIHAGVTLDDLRTHFPSTFAALQSRMSEVQTTMNVDNAPALV
jgi:hypothetical protein